MRITHSQKEKTTQTLQQSLVHPKRPLKMQSFRNKQAPKPTNYTIPITTTYKCRTTQTSPRMPQQSPQRLPALLASTNNLIAKKNTITSSQESIPHPKGLLKTTKLVDQLLKILKNQQDPPKTAKPLRIFTQGHQQFLQPTHDPTKTSKTKRPRIISNHVTKLLFNNAHRPNVSQDRPRKMRSRASQQVQEITFYGGKEITFYGGTKFPMHKGQGEGKEGLDGLRVSKMRDRMVTQK